MYEVTQSSLNQASMNDRMGMDGNMDSVDDDLETVVFSEEDNNLETCTVPTETNSQEDAGQGFHGVTNDDAANRLQSQHVLGSHAQSAVSHPSNSGPDSCSALVVLLVPELRPHASIPLAHFPVTLPTMHMTWELLPHPSISGGEGVEAEKPQPRTERGVLYCLVSRYGEPLKPSNFTQSTPPERLVCVCKIGRDNIPQSLKILRTATRNQQNLQYKHTVSREHCTVRFHFKLQQNSPNGSSAVPPVRKPFYKWTSFDITDLSSSNGTYCRSVRLSPSHRYSFPLTKQNIIHCVELQLGSHYQCTIRVVGDDTTIPGFDNTVAADELPTPLAVVDASVQFSPSPEAVLPTLSPHGKGPRKYPGLSPFYVDDGDDGSIEITNVEESCPPLDDSAAKTTWKPSEESKNTETDVPLTSRGGIQSGEEIRTTAPLTLPKSAVVKTEQKEKIAPPPRREEEGIKCRRETSSTQVAPSKVIDNGYPLMIVTTGIHYEEKVLRALTHMNICINPKMSNYKWVTHLVIKRPLMRSIKLLTVLPYVKHLVDSAWFDSIISCIPKDSAPRVPSLSTILEKFNPEKFCYTETRRADSIESVNDFSLKQLMATSPEKRQTLFNGLVFYLHPEAKPQGDRENDLRHVIVASGGKHTRIPSCASVAILPEVDMLAAGVAWEKAADCPREPRCIFVTAEDLFRSVLQQRRLEKTTVRRPAGCTTLPPPPEIGQKRKRSM